MPKGVPNLNSNSKPNRQFSPDQDPTEVARQLLVQGVTPGTIRRRAFDTKDLKLSNFYRKVADNMHSMKIKTF